MKKIVMALAAASMLAMPAAAANPNNKGGKGAKVGQQLRVCLVTFANGDNKLASNVTRAQFLPLPVANRLEMRVVDDFQAIYTYGRDGGTGTGVDFSNVDAGSFDLENDFDMDTTTREACEFLADQAESRDMDDDDGKDRDGD